MKYKKYLLAAAALVLIGATSIKPTMAYFTDSHQAKGTVTVHLGDLEITPNENAHDWVKEITVENTGDYDIFVRVKAIYGSQFGIGEFKGEGWTYNADGYYYYDSILAPGESSKTLNLTIIAKDGFEYSTFNVVIVQEAAKAQNVKDEDGNIIGVKAVWDEAVMTKDSYKAQFEDVTTKKGDNN